MAGLSFVNQIGAVEGMNQAAPGTLIPESFVRWSQDVLFDRAGLMRRRGPFSEFKTYKEVSLNVKQLFDVTSSEQADEKVLGIFSTYDPLGNVRIGMLVHIKANDGDVSTVLRVFDSSFLFLGSETLPFDVSLLSIVNAKPALGGGVWISIASDPADPTTHYQFFWRGGSGSIPAGGIADNFITKNSCSFIIDTGISTFDSEHGGYSTSINVPDKTSLTKGQFVFVKISADIYRYVGTIADIPTDVNKITLEKRPFMWDTLIDNNHNVSYSIVSSAGNGGTPNNITFRIAGPAKVLFVAEDNITITSHSVSGYNTDHIIASVVETLNVDGTINYTTIVTKTLRTSDGTGGLMKMRYDIQTPTLTQNLVFSSVRPYMHLHGRGLINTSTDNMTFTGGTIGTNAEGHWKSAEVTGWNVYRASDNAYLGKVKTIGDDLPTTTNDNSVGTFYADPGLNIAGDEYIMAPVVTTNLTSTTANSFTVNARSSNDFSGLYTAVYAGYQWYGNFGKDDQNTNRLVFSAPHNREAVDLSRDAADSIIFPGKSKFRGMGASSAGLLVFLEDRTYILRGNDRTNFSVEQLVPDGCLCPTSIVEYGGGVFWAAKAGIMFFDGASVRNLTKDNLGLYYSDSLDEFDPEQDRVMGFIHKNNLIMHYTSWKSPFNPVRYEPVYAADWQNTEGIKDRAWDEFDPDFDYDDFFTENNTPIYWDRKILNNPEESASTGLSIKYQNGIYAKTVLGTTIPTTFDANYIFMPDLSIENEKLKKWNGSSYSNVTPQIAVGFTAILLATKVYYYTGTDYTNPTVVIWGGTSWKPDTKSGILWQNDSNINKYGPLRKNTSITFNVYLPTNSITTFSNLDFRGVTNAETIYGLKTILGVNSIEDVGSSNKFRARFIDIHPVYDLNTNGMDVLLVEKINIPTADLVMGPDFYIQTKHFTVGDPILRKWFQRIMLSMLLYDGAIRMDLVDDDDNDEVDINKKKHKYWEVFTEKGYSWAYLTDIVFPKIVSPNKSNWFNIEASITLWDEVFTADFNRYSKRISWRKASVGFRLYQLNDYKKPFNGVVTRPYRVEMQGFSVGFKPLRQGRV